MPSNSETAEFQVGDTVRKEFACGSMGPATIIAIAMDKAWCFYPQCNAHLVHSLKLLEILS